MLFSTDTQTQEDLNIFGKHDGQGIFGLFNQCLTHGGASFMKALFHTPLSDAGKINQRSSIIRHFSINICTFPFQPALFDQVELYLSNTDERSRLSQTPVSAIQKISQFIAKDTDSIVLKDGIEALVTLLRLTYQFINSSQAISNRDYEEERTYMAELLGQLDMTELITGAGKLSTGAIIHHDNHFRFRHRGILLKVLNCLYQLDVFLTVARVASSNGFTFPEATESDGCLVTLSDFQYPGLKNAVSNTIQIDQESGIVFLTGANMAGKSTLMKSLSIAVYLAHMGFPVAAKCMRFSVLEGIYTTINLPDNLLTGASHFYTEVLRLKKIARELKASRKLFVVFDELFRGTNVKDAHEATVAVTTAFAKQHRSIFLISTHIIEAGEDLKKQHSNIHFLFLPTRMEGNQPVYTYQLETGISSDRHGMMIIRNEGILDLLEHGQKGK